MNKIMKSFAFLVLISFLSFEIHAEIRYIDDTVKIPLRTGASTEHRIISFLNSGTKVDVQYLKDDDDSWAFVKLDAGSEGWVQVRYLKNTPAAKDLLTYSQQEQSKLKEQNKLQSQTIKDLNTELKNLKNDLENLKKHSASADKELEHIKDISINAIRLDTSNNQLLEENELLKAKHEESTHLVTKLENNQKNQGILYGALAVLLGIILGWLMPKMRGSRNDGWV